jgi:hypothetical protein
MSEHEGVTKVEVETDFTITGRLARFGRGGMIQDVSNRLLRDFADCLRSSIEGPAPEPTDSTAASPSAESARSPADASPASPPEAKPVRGFSLLMGVLWERIRRLFRRER